jgi:hypothetical protein
MRRSLEQIAEWANRMSDSTEGKERETFNYLGHYSLLAAAIISRESTFDSPETI